MTVGCVICTIHAPLRARAAARQNRSPGSNPSLQSRSLASPPNPLVLSSPCSAAAAPPPPARPPPPPLTLIHLRSPTSRWRKRKEEEEAARGRPAASPIFSPLYPGSPALAPSPSLSRRWRRHGGGAREEIDLQRHAPTLSPSAEAAPLYSCSRMRPRRGVPGRPRLPKAPEEDGTWGWTEYGGQGRSHGGQHQQQVWQMFPNPRLF